MPRRRRPVGIAVLAVPTAASAIALSVAVGIAQTAPPDPNTGLLQPSLSGSPAKPPRFRRAGDKLAPPTDRFAAPSRIGATPIYGSPSGFGAGDTGFEFHQHETAQEARATLFN